MAVKENTQGLNVHFDKELAFSESQGILAAANTASTNYIELASVDSPKGTPIKGNIFIEELVGTLTVKVYGAVDAEPTTSDELLKTIEVGAGVTGVVSFTLAQTDEINNIKLFYTAGTSAKISSALTIEV